MKRLVIFSFDTFGDLTLRQSFFKELLDLGYEITVVVREPFAVILPFLDSRLKWISISKEINPYNLTPDHDGYVLHLKEQIAAINPDALVSICYFYTELEIWTTLFFTQLPRYGFYNPDIAHLFQQKFPGWYHSLQGQKGFFSNYIYGLNKPDHEFSKTKAMFAAITGKELTALPQIQLSEKTLLKNQNLLSSLSLQAGKYVFTSLAGNTNMPIKLLPIETSAKVIQHITQKHNLPALLTGIQSELNHLNQIEKRCQELGVPVKIWIGNGDSFDSLLYLLQQSSFYYGSDTGTMHMAAAMNKPLLAHFGGGTWPRFLPLAQKSYLLTQKLPCFACDWNCWAGKPLCINLVAPEKFYVAVDWILDESTQGNIADEGVPLDPALNMLIHNQFVLYKNIQPYWKRILKRGLRLITAPIRIPLRTIRRLVRKKNFTPLPQKKPTSP